MKGDHNKITKQMLDEAISRLSHLKDYTIPEVKYSGYYKR